jgi:hypothetical protein
VVLGEMVETWRAAWERRAPSRPELALRAVAEDPDRVSCSGERLCEHCYEEIPPDRGRKGRPAMYCSDGCRQRANYERSRAVA